MKNLVINVDRWIQGGTITSFLLNGNGHMCCLGFLAMECGASENDIYGYTIPLQCTELNWPKEILKNKELTNKILATNDSDLLSLEERKSKLKELFLKMDYNLSFE